MAYVVVCTSVVLVPDKSSIAGPSNCVAAPEAVRRMLTTLHALAAVHPTKAWTVTAAVVSRGVR